MEAREVDWHDRGHFFAVAARLMRRILVEHARRRDSGKRGAASFRGGPITTATDVYALGVLLYRLLTGHLPYRLAGGRLPPGARAEPRQPRRSAPGRR